MTVQADRLLRRVEFLLTCLLRGMTDCKVRDPHIYKFLLTCLLRGMTEIFFVNLKAQNFYSHASCEA